MNKGIHNIYTRMTLMRIVVLRIKLLVRNIRKNLTSRGISLYIVVLPLSTFAYENQATTNKHIEFDSSFLNGISVDLSNFSDGNPIPPGLFSVDIIINNKQYGKYDILFKKVAGKKSAEPWLTHKQIVALGIISPLQDVEHSHPLQDWVTQSSYDYNSGDFILNILVPQASIIYRPEGYVPPEMWQKGSSVVFLNYNVNYYSSQSQSDSHHSIVSGYKNYLSTFIDAGANIKDWHLRNSFNLDLTGERHLDSTNLYIEHAVPALNSVLTAGEKETNSDIIPGFRLRGINLETDSQMLPDSYNSYHPILQGVAQTNAHIIVMQNGHKIYQSNVSPGPFELKDINTSDYSNDLQLIIKEADGKVKTQTIPMANPPLILTKGQHRYSLSVGQVNNNDYKRHPLIMAGTWRYGLTSKYTYYTGFQVNNNYKAFAVGNSINTFLGGFSFNLIQSMTELNNKQHAAGHSVGITYSKLISSTGTSLSLASYKNASKGFYTLAESLNENTNKNNKYKNTSENDEGIYDKKFKNYHMKQRWSLVVSQRIKNVGYLSVSGMLVRYWNDDEMNKQYNFRFSRNEKYFTWMVGSTLGYNSKGHSEKSWTLSIDVPFSAFSKNNTPLFNSWNSDASFDSGKNSSVSTNLYGSTSEQLSYNIGYRTDHNSRSASNSINGSTSYIYPYGQIGSSFTTGKLKQLSLSANGSLVMHRGGVIVAPNLGNASFAIIEAKGAVGAKIYNGNKSQINSSGYGILTGLMPYRKNEVRLDLDNLPDNVDIEDNIQTVIPEDGAAVMVNFKTKVGQAIFIVLKDKYNHFLPLATPIVDDNGNSLGIVGQAGIAYIRGWDMKGSKLYAIDDAGNKKCSVTASYDMQVKVNKFHKDIIRLEAKCK